LKKKVKLLQPFHIERGMRQRVSPNFSRIVWFGWGVWEVWEVWEVWGERGGIE
jgi:hypothetical protein